MADEAATAEESTEETTAATSTEETAADTKVTPEDDWKAKSRKNERAAKQASKELEEARKKLKAFEDRDKSETDKLTEKASEAEKRAERAEKALLRAQVAGEKKLPAELADRLQGDTKEELEADAERLAELVKPAGAPTVDTDAGKGSGSSGETSFNDIIRGASVRG